jgi:hypothetical protein
MSNIRKVRCPHCETINTVDIDEELIKHKQPIFRHTMTYVPTVTFVPEPPPPEIITVRCSNPKCKKKFKIKVD